MTDPYVPPRRGGVTANASNGGPPPGGGHDSAVMEILVSVAMPEIPDSTIEEIIPFPAAEWRAMTAGQRRDRLEELAAAARARHVRAWAQAEDQPSGDRRDARDLAPAAARGLLLAAGIVGEAP